MTATRAPGEPTRLRLTEAWHGDADTALAAALVARIDAASRERRDALSEHDRRGFVASELSAVHVALRSVLERGLARGPVFCEWGSGLGAVCAVAAALSYEAHGIEIQQVLVEGARELVAEMGCEAVFAHGSFVLPGDEDLMGTSGETYGESSHDVYADLGLTPAECDVVFAYPWPGEDRMYDRLFARHAEPGALLVTFHEHARVLIQRRTDDADELESLGWFGEPA